MGLYNCGWWCASGGIDTFLFSKFCLNSHSTYSKVPFTWGVTIIVLVNTSTASDHAVINNYLSNMT